MTDPFSGLTAPEARRCIASARLSGIDKEIARLRYVDRKTLAETGAYVHLDRSAIGYRLRRIILPELKLTVLRRLSYKEGRHF